MSDEGAMKVARIISDREVVLTRGEEDGIEEGQIFRILDPKELVISDPDTGEVLETILQTKAFVRAVKVLGRATIARTFRKKQVNVGGKGSQMVTLAEFFTPPRYEERVETLRIDPSMGEPLANTESIVSVGDVAIPIAPDEVGIEAYGLFK